MIYLDNAATTGRKPPEVISAVNNALQTLSANPGRSGHRISEKAATEMYETRALIADTFSASGAENVIFTLNCTQSINTVLKGVLRDGDHVVTSDLEHNAVMRPLVKTGVSYTAVEVSLTDDSETLERFENAVTDRTRLIIVTAASNVCGKTLPLEGIGKIAEKHGILFAVDGAQGAGVIPIDMKRMNIDFLCIAPHKGFYAPMGTGILIAEKPIGNTIIEGGTGTDSVSFVQPLSTPEGFESGTVNLPGICGIKAGVKYVKRLGARVVRHETALALLFYGELKKTEGVLLYTPAPDFPLYAPVISFNIEGLNSQVVANLLNRHGIAVRAGLHCAPAAHRKLGTLDIGTVRVSPAVFNTKTEMEKTAEVIKKISDNRKKLIEI